VLVHGAFADGSSWSKVIRFSSANGYTVIAVQNPLTSFAADVETTKRVVDGQAGPVVLVGHSYGGAVITQAAAGSANVKALVYVAAFAPEVGRADRRVRERYRHQLGTGFDRQGRFSVHDPRGSTSSSPLMSRCRDPRGGGHEKPIIGSVFGAAPDPGGVEDDSVMVIVSQDDKAINPDLGGSSNRMKAKTTEVKSSHVPFLSHPAVVARVNRASSRCALTWIAAAFSLRGGGDPRRTGAHHAWCDKGSAAR